jgi:CheY-like chemotaxis protein
LSETAFSPTVFRVTDGEQAIAFVSQTGPYVSAPKQDLVLLDLNLPRKSGFDVLAVIRQDPELALVPVIVFSTSMSRCDRERALELGASDYITKRPTSREKKDPAVSGCISSLQHPARADSF